MDAVSPVLDNFGRPYRNGDAPRDYMPLPYPSTFAAIYSGPDRTNWHDRFDEAMRTRRTDALAMKKDDFLGGLIQERKLAVSCLPWHLEVPDEKDQVQVHVRDAIDKTIRDIDELEWIFQALLEAIWYGRYGVQIKWKWGRQGQYKVLTVQDWDPVNGDKIGHQQDRTPYILIHGSEASTLRGAKVIQATISKAVSLRGQWRQNFIIHKNEVNDADFFRGEESEGRWGVGVRSNLYWPWWLRQELREWGTTFFERVGLGLTVWYYDMGNPTALAAAQKAAKEQSRRTNLFVPIPSDGKGNGKGWVERHDTPVSGSEAIGKMIEGLEKHMERYVVGQEASSKSGGSTGLGNEEGSRLQASTKYNIARRDAKYFQSTLTGSELNPGLVWMIQRYSFPETLPERPNGFRVRLVFDLENPESEKRLQAGKTLMDMGVSLKADEVRGAAGYSKPTEGDEVIEPPEQPGSEGTGGGDPSAPGGNPLAALMGGGAEGEQQGGEEGQEQEAGDFLAGLKGESAAMQRELAAYYAWENRGKASDGKKNIWYDPDTKQRRVQISEPGTRKAKQADQPAGRPAAKAKPEKAAKPTVDEVGDFLTGLNRDQITPEILAETAKGLMQMTVPQLKALKDKLGLGISGKMVKSDLAKKIAERALHREPDSLDLGGMEPIPEDMPEHWIHLAAQSGISPHDLHKAALDIHAKDAAAKTEQAKGIWIAQHYGADAAKLRDAYATKDTSYINKFRGVAERLGPLMFPGAKHFEAHLYNALAEGPPQPMSQDYAYQQALELQGKAGAAQPAEVSAPATESTTESAPATAPPAIQTAVPPQAKPAEQPKATAAPVAPATKPPATFNPQAHVAPLLAAIDKHGKGSNLAELADVRDELKHLPREQQDAAIHAAMKAGHVSPVGSEGGMSGGLPQRHRDAQLRLKNEQNGIGYLSRKQPQSSSPSFAPTDSSPRPERRAPAPNTPPTQPATTPQQPVATTAQSADEAGANVASMMDSFTIKPGESHADLNKRIAGTSLDKLNGTVDAFERSNPSTTQVADVLKKIGIVSKFPSRKAAIAAIRRKLLNTKGVWDRTYEDHQDIDPVTGQDRKPAVAASQPAAPAEQGQAAPPVPAQQTAPVQSASKQPVSAATSKGPVAAPNGTVGPEKLKDIASKMKELAGKTNVYSSQLPHQNEIAKQMESLDIYGLSDKDARAVAKQMGINLAPNSSRHDVDKKLRSAVMEPYTVVRGVADTWTPQMEKEYGIPDQDPYEPPEREKTPIKEKASKQTAKPAATSKPQAAKTPLKPHVATLAERVKEISAAAVADKSIPVESFEQQLKSLPLENMSRDDAIALADHLEIPVLKGTSKAAAIKAIRSEGIASRIVSDGVEF